MRGSEPRALPLGDIPLFFDIYIIPRFTQFVKLKIKENLKHFCSCQTYVTSTLKNNI